MITQDQLKHICHYNPDTGEFVRIRKRSWTGNEYECKSFPNSNGDGWGYLQMNIDRVVYKVHRLIFLYMTGEFPKCDVDHVNGNRTDNRWENLRLVSRQENLRNMGLRQSNTSGVCGASYDRNRSAWHAYIGTGNKRTHIGYFGKKEDAVKARTDAERKYEYHVNHGKRDVWVA